MKNMYIYIYLINYSTIWSNIIPHNKVRLMLQNCDFCLFIVAMESLCRGSLGEIHQWLLGTAKHHQLLLIQTLTPFPPLSTHLLLPQVSTSKLCLLIISFFQTLEHTG